MIEALEKTDNMDRDIKTFARTEGWQWVKMELADKMRQYLETSSSDMFEKTTNEEDAAVMNRARGMHFIMTSLINTIEL